MIQHTMPPTSTSARHLAVRTLSTGRVRGKQASAGPRRYLPGGWSSADLPVHVHLVQHPDGMCLFDTGQSSRAVSRGYFPWWYPFFRLARFELAPDDEAGNQLWRDGYRPSDVRWVVLSHLHTDHAGGLGDFTASEVLVSRAEWGLATDRRARLRTRGYLPQHWPSGLEPSLVDFDGPAVGPFPGSFDLAGDGELLLVPTPGHTPGHMSLLVQQEHGGYLLAGDLVHSAAELAGQAPDIHAFCRRQELTVLTAHDPDIPWEGPA